MIRAVQQYFASISPVFVDGLLYVLIALFGACISSFNSEEAYKYINPYVLYWTKEFSTWGLAVVTALKMFRSTAYSTHIEEKKKASGNTEVFTKP